MHTQCVRRMEIERQGSHSPLASSHQARRARPSKPLTVTTSWPAARPRPQSVKLL
jgi:hypothetical protein